MASAQKLDVKRADRTVWLLKVPPSVSRAWESERTSTSQQAGEEMDPELGRIRMEYDPIQESSEFTLNLAGVAPGPKKWKMHFNRAGDDGGSDAQMHMHIFSESAHAAGVAVDGVVKQKFTLTPSSAAELDPAYRKLSKDRLIKSQNPKATLKVIERGAATLVMPLPTAGVDRKQQLVGRGGKVSDLKRMRLEGPAGHEKEPLQNLLFTLFERAPLWAFNDLQEKTEQPAVWLKEVLNDIAYQNKMGANKGQWEIKPEYRTKAMEEHAARAAADAEENPPAKKFKGQGWR